MRDERFTFLCNAEERRILATLAQRLQRSQSDAIRLVIREAVKGLTTDATQPTVQPQPAPAREVHRAPNA